jgi:hypothetical protein
MDWEILYYSAEVQETIDAWPVGIRAYYARITERVCTRLAEVQRRGEKWER